MAKVTSKAKTTGGGDLKALIKKLDKLNSKPSKVAVGLPRDAVPYPDGTSVIMVGTVNEFGSIDGVIPERSWLRVGIATSSKAIIKKWKDKLAKGVLNGTIKPEKALALIGQLAVAAVQKRIVNIQQPANAEFTLKAKRPKTSPLIVTGHMRQSVRYVVNPNVD